MSLFNAPVTGGGKKEEGATLGGDETALDRMAGFVSELASRTAPMTGTALTTTGPSEIYFPPEMIAGCGPHIEGREEEMAWQAAAEALDSERLHIVSTVEHGMIWFLAVRSSDLSSHPFSWCPFAALLPGMPDAADGPALYIHHEDGIATLLSIGAMEMGVHRGSVNIIQVKAERLSRDMNDAPIANLLPERMDALTPIPWRSISLLEDKARRFLAVSSVLSGLAIAVLAFAIWILATFASLTTGSTLQQEQKESQAAVESLMRKAMALRTSPLRNQLAHFADLNDELIKIGGWLKTYEITGTRIQWKAVLPPSVTSDVITHIGGHTQEITDDGIVVTGNS